VDVVVAMFAVVVADAVAVGLVGYVIVEGEE